jgi:hypothetical protein
MKIIIGASRNCKIGSKLLQWWMGTSYSHVYARWFLDAQEREVVYQASHGMVHFKEFRNFQKENTIVQEFELLISDKQFKRFSQKCIDLAGQPYSKLELAQIFFYDVTGSSKECVDRHGYICSELMCELLEDLGYRFNKPKYLVTPKDIVETLSEG